jgi:hypothetical protein
MADAQFGVCVDNGVAYCSQRRLWSLFRRQSACRVYSSGVGTSLRSEAHPGVSTVGLLAGRHPFSGTAEAMLWTRPSPASPALSDGLLLPVWGGPNIRVATRKVVAADWSWGKQAVLSQFGCSPTGCLRSALRRHLPRLSSRASRERSLARIDRPFAAGIVESDQNTRMPCRAVERAEEMPDPPHRAIRSRPSDSSNNSPILR